MQAWIDGTREAALLAGGEETAAGNRIVHPPHRRARDDLPPDAWRPDARRRDRS